MSWLSELALTNSGKSPEPGQECDDHDERDRAEEMNDLGVSLRKLGRANEAIELYERAIALKPDYAEAFNNRGNALKDRGLMNEAVASYDRAIALKPDYAEAFCNRGNALKELGRLDEALASYDNAIRIKPDHATFHTNRGNVLQDLKRADEAIASYNEAITLDADYASAYANRGNAFAAVKRFDEAIASYDQAIALNPSHKGAWNNRGIALKELGQFGRALDSFRRAIDLDPTCVAFLINCGNVLQALQRYDEAIVKYEKAIVLNPDCVEAYNNVGVSHNALMHFDAALAAFDAALRLSSNHHEARWNRALVYLLTGRFSFGWRDYESRKAIRSRKGNRRFAAPLWLGDADISEKTIFVHAEQGFGDTIQFCRYVPLLKRAGATVLFAPQNALKSLMQRLDTKPRIVDCDDENLSYDFHCPLMSLPLAFGTEVETIPRNQRYLSVDRAKLAEWARKLGKRTRPRIGVAWSGSRERSNELQRSIGLSLFRQLFCTGFEFFSLQKEVREEDRDFLAATNIVDFGPELKDFEDTAALCSLMDVVVSVDTAVAHLGGAMELPVLLLLPWLPDWRWMLNRADSPWYPSMRLFRQSMRGDWETVLEDVRRELEARFRGV